MFIEVEGKWVQANDDGTPKLGEDKNPLAAAPDDVIKFLAEKAKSADVSKLDLETLAKSNPALAEYLKTSKTAVDELDAIKKKSTDDETEAKKKKGEFETLFTTEQSKNKEISANLDKANGIVQKQNETLQKVFDQLLKEVPEDKRSLIPEDYGVDRKISYILANSAILGTKPLGAGGKVPADEGNKNLTEEATIQKEIDDLMAKTTRTPQEGQILWEKSKKLKELQAKPQKKD